MSKAETTRYTTSHRRIEYRKNGDFFVKIISLIAAPILFCMSYFDKQHDLKFYVFLLLGIIAAIFTIYSLRDYISNKLVIGDDYVEIDRKRIPAYSIKEVKRKRYVIKLKTVNQNVVIDMNKYLAFSNEEAVNEVHKKLAGFVPEASNKK